MRIISNALALFITIVLAVTALHGAPEQHASTALIDDALFCMVQNVYHEARDQSPLGQAAVAHVTLNRVKSPAYPDSVCDVVWQKGQFSWTNDGKSDRMNDPAAIQKAVDIALAVSRGKIKDPTGGALHYFAHRKARPTWAKGGFRFILGEHTFVKIVGK
jgi:spore germination cell wall hydrolase CwlJ-like protein